MNLVEKHWPNDFALNHYEAAGHWLGGREHALVWKLAQSPHVTQMWCAPGNAGIAEERLTNGNLVSCLPMGAEDLGALLAFADREAGESDGVGPDNPLALGLWICFRKRLRIWAEPEGAQFESSKVSCRVHEETWHPHGGGGTFSEAAARTVLRGAGRKVCRKGRRPGFGQGRLICNKQAEAEKAVDEK